VRFLDRLGRQSGTGPGVSALRETERIRSLSRFVDCRIVIGQFGGLSSLARETARAVRARGADVVLVDEPDARAQAEAANRFQAHAYLGLEATFDPEVSLCYYKVPSFSSPAGEALAEQLRSTLSPLTTGLPGQSGGPVVEGIRLPVLRETRMPAVLCRLGPVRAIVDDAPRLAQACAAALQAWVEAVPPTSSIT